MQELIIQDSRLIRDFPESFVIKKEHKTTDAGPLAIIQTLKNLDDALELARASPEIRAVLNTKEGITILQQNLDRYNAWRRLDSVTNLIPIARNLQELEVLYKKHYASTELFFTRKDWLKVLFSFEDYRTLKKLVEMHAAGEITIAVADVLEIRECIVCYPLDIFPVIWRVLGKVEDLVLILRDRNFRVTDKEFRLVPILEELSLSSAQAELLLRESLGNAPRVFTLLYKEYPELGQRLLEEEIVVEDGITLSQLQIIETSIFSVLGENLARETTKDFALRLLESRVAGYYTRDQRETAWKFASTYLEKDKDREFFLNLRALETPDNKLYLDFRLASVL